MKKNYTLVLGIFSLFLATSLYGQAFRKGSLLVSISEGSTKAMYNTNDISDGNPKPVKHKCVDGVRDPIIIEYGVSNKWSLSLTSGNDIFTVNPSDYYNFRNTGNKIDAKTNELTFDVSYHVFVSKNLDVSVFSGAGAFSVGFSGVDNGDNWYKYQSNGSIVRVGTRARYYFWKRLGAFGMVSSYNARSSTKDIKDNTVGNNISTNINGFAVEMGLCYRIFN